MFQKIGPNQNKLPNPIINPLRQVLNCQNKVDKVDRALFQTKVTPTKLKSIGPKIEGSTSQPTKSLNKKYFLSLKLTLITIIRRGLPRTKLRLSKTN